MKLFQVEAFAKELFQGNPAAICPLSEWLPDETLQLIATENNLAETAFFIPAGDAYHLRWFTPAVEVDLCGHATLASAHVLFEHLGFAQNEITFQTRSGQLLVQRHPKGYAMNFPTDQLEPVTAPTVLWKGLDITEQECYRGRDDYMVVVENQSIIEQLQPDFRCLAQLDARGVIVTAPGNDVDFVSRCFYTPTGINEDPVTGSAHTSMTPYWSKRLGKTALTGQQLSRRSGTVYCQAQGERVVLAGAARTYLIGEILF